MNPKVVDMQGRPVQAQAGSALGTLGRLALPKLRKAVSEVLVKADDTLFDLMQSSTGTSETQALIDAMRLIRLNRAAIETSFEKSLGNGIASLELGYPEIAGDTKEPGKRELTLLAEDDLEESLGAQTLAENLARRTGSDYEQLTGRLAALCPTVEFTSRHNPLGPEHIAEGVRAGLKQIEISVRVRLILFKLIERGIAGVMGPLHAELNRILRDAGIASRHGSGEARPAPAPAPRAPRDERDQEYGGTVAGDGRAERGGADDQLSHEDVELVRTLQELLRQQRGKRPAEPLPPGVTPMAHQEMLSILSVFQAQPPETLTEALSDPGDSLAERLKRELLAGAIRFGVPAENARVSPADEDTLDLVGMLFEVLLSERVLQDKMRGTLSRLVVPYTKAALIDKKMFLQKAHPARKLLNSLAEASESVTGDSPQDREVKAKVEGTVDRLVVEFNEDVAIFKELEEEFRDFIETYRKRMELAERRAHESQRGKERLDQARATASAELAVRLGQLEPPPAIEDVLRRYWVHHTTVTWLRQGDGSDAYHQALAEGDTIISAMIAAKQGGTALDAQREALHAALNAVLASSGISGEAVVPVISGVESTLRAMSGGTELPEVFTVPAHMFEVDAEAEEELQITAAQGINADSGADDDFVTIDPEQMKRIDALESGDWIELVDDNGHAEPAKLSWVSPISGRRLFVNRRGLKVCCASVDELAVMMSQGKMSIRDADSAFERAMHQVLGKLQQEGGKPAA
jgi:hypothetical protein